jgi:hypothetical protein
MVLVSYLSFITCGSMFCLRNMYNTRCRYLKHPNRLQYVWNAHAIRSRVCHIWDRQPFRRNFICMNVCISHRHKNVESMLQTYPRNFRTVLRPTIPTITHPRSHTAYSMFCSSLPVSGYSMTGLAAGYGVQGLEFLATYPEVRVRFPTLPDFLRSSGSGTGSTQPREYSWGATWKKK